MKRHAALAIAALATVSSTASAVGESKNGFPNWGERVLLEWANRARVEPALEMQKCGAKCGEAACFKPVAPLSWNEKANHAARFHAAHMDKNGYFAHDSKCAIVPNIDALFPGSCDGSAGCACEGGTLTGATAWSSRIKLFGVSASAEIIASPEDPNSAFYLWLYENSPDPTCQYSGSNGHRWSLLTNTSGVGFGISGNAVGDFGSGGEPAYPIPSGSHYPASGASVELWANWSETAGPKQALVNIEGTCQPMKLTRGVPENGAYLATAAGLSGCARYYFRFEKSDGTEFTYPSTGSLGIGDATCLEWSATRPAAGAGCNCAPSCAGKACGDDGCGGDCGACAGGTTCDGTGQCACPAGTTSCGGACVNPAIDNANCGVCGTTCSGDTTCIAGTCQTTGGTGGAGQAGGTGTAGSGTAGAGTAGSGTAGAGTAGSGTAGSGTAGSGTGGSSTGGAASAGKGGTSSAGKAGAAAAGKAGAGGASTAGKAGTSAAGKAGASGGSAGASGAAAAAAADSDDSGGCGCKVDRKETRAAWGLSALAALTAFARRRRAKRG